ncbi:MAG: hypothetical protein CMJ19_17545 [Phycisphaeraceae bacterium]|nr:hypothetical protein [Phycisphaeraceae bacterium]
MNPDHNDDRVYERIFAPRTAERLGKELTFIFPGSHINFVARKENEIPDFSFDPGSKCRVHWDEKTKQIWSFLYSVDTSIPVRAVALLLLQEPDDFDMQFARAYTRVFNADVLHAYDVLRHRDSWESLMVTRIPRAIATLSPFSTKPFSRWLKWLQDAMQLRYEGRVFQSTLFMTKNLNTFASVNEDNFVKFDVSQSLNDFLFREKWGRAISNNGDVGVLGIGRSGRISGLVSIPHAGIQEDCDMPLPTPLYVIAKMLVPGTMAFVCTENSDLYVILNNGAVFVKTQGRWHFRNYNSFSKLMMAFLPEEISASILQYSLDLSYKRHGALFCIPDNVDEIQKIVPDYRERIRPNSALRDAVGSLCIHNDSHRRMLLAVSALDGALVISNEGNVFDAACMIGQPEQSRLDQIGLKKFKRFAGARTTAAWNASVYGTSIKISEDGLITLFRYGKIIGEMG